DLITAVDACRTADAFVLQPVAYVDAGWTDLHADAAVDAITEPAVARVSRLWARSPGLAAGMVVGDDERVAIEHHALEACVGTHVLAHLLAHETRVPVCCEPIEEHPKRFPAADLPGDGTNAQIVNRREIAHEGIACPQGNGEPSGVLERLDHEFLE